MAKIKIGHWRRNNNKERWMESMDKEINRIILPRIRRARRTKIREDFFFFFNR